MTGKFKLQFLLLSRAVLCSGAATFLLGLSLMLSSCASSGAHCQGGFNAFDCNAFQALATAQAVIEQAKVQFGADPTAKPLINKAIASYNAAEDAYLAYHAALAAGGVPDSATLTQLLGALADDIASVKSTFKIGALGAPTARNGTQAAAAKGGAA